MRYCRLFRMLVIPLRDCDCALGLAHMTPQGTSKHATAVSNGLKQPLRLRAPHSHATLRFQPGRVYIRNFDYLIGGLHSWQSKSDRSLPIC
jgi:hypothetical protein